MKNKITASIILVILVLGLVHVTFNFTPFVLSEPGSGRREVWQVVNVTNPMPYNTAVDVNVSVNSRNGVYIACTSGVTEYFNNSAYWQGLGYNSYWDWLNGTIALMYHWGDMDWFVSNGSLTPITYSEIQFWGPMYFDSGGGVSYTTFMDNTYMADYNLTRLGDDPDIVSQAFWQWNQIKLISSMIVPASSTVNVVFKIVITESGGYTFNVVTTPGVTVSPSTWNVGGYATLLVPYDHATIQGAINAANPGDTIVVYEGSYSEDLTISSAKTDIDLKSFLGSSVTIKGVQNVPVGSFPLAAPNIAVNASGVKIHGFTIEGPNYAAGYYSSGLVIGAKNVEIFDNAFRVTSAADTGEISQAIQTWHRNAASGVDISGLNVHNNTFTNLGSEAAGYEAIYINLDTGNNSATVWNNTFSGKLVRAITTERSNVTVTDNRIITDLAPNLPGGYQGINVGGVNSGNVTNISVTGNTIKGSATANGFMFGIKIGYAGSTLTAISIMNNTIQMNDVGVRVATSASGIRIKWNNFDNNTDYAVRNDDTTQTLDSSYNWWGNETGPYHSTLNPSGSGDEVSDYVVFEPWLLKSNPPLTPISVVHVNPLLVGLTTPSLGTQFTVNVTIANVSMLYGYQFSLLWNSSILSLVSAVPKVPSVWGANYISNANQTAGNYSFYAAARSPAPTFNGTIAAAILTFRSIYDPPYPANATCNLALQSVKISDSAAKPILHLVYNGNYSCYSVRPQLLFREKQYAAKKVPTEFDTYVNVTGIVNLYAFNFTVTFDANLLRPVLDPQAATVFVTADTVIVGWLNDTVYVNVSGITPPVNGSVALARIRFKVQQGFVWNTETAIINSSLNFTIHNLATQGGAPIDHDAVNGSYVYKPVPGDLSMDGLVDIVDLLTVAGQFGTSPGTPYVAADLNHDGVIDIFDIILVARNFGRTEP